MSGSQGVLVGRSSNLNGVTLFFDTNTIVNYFASNNDGSKIHRLTENEAIRVVVTAAVERDVARILYGTEYAAYLSWFYGNQPQTEIFFSDLPPGGNNGEWSIVDATTRYGASGPIVVVSGDEFGEIESQWQSALSQDVTVLNSVEFANSLLRSGSLSYNEYGLLILELLTVVLASEFNVGGVPIQYQPGQTYIIDGVEVQFRFCDVVVDGNPIGLEDRFEIQNDGQVEYNSAFHSSELKYGIDNYSQKTAELFQDTKAHLTPLVLDLDGDGVELTAQVDGNVAFDLDGDQFAEWTGWVAPDDGLLAIDLNGNGRIDDVSELFGGAPCITL